MFYPLLAKIIFGPVQIWNRKNFLFRWKNRSNSKAQKKPPIKLPLLRFLAFFPSLVLYLFFNKTERRFSGSVLRMWTSDVHDDQILGQTKNARGCKHCKRPTYFREIFLTIIGLERFHFCVRDGNRWSTLGISPLQCPQPLRTFFILFFILFLNC